MPCKILWLYLGNVFKNYFVFKKKKHKNMFDFRLPSNWVFENCSPNKVYFKNVSQKISYF